ncbi:MAG: hypothetical protein H7Y38_19500 [Armatimonadetes bacterium]|nr:hypothetical protein [Armatimonadota bacterium]
MKPQMRFVHALLINAGIFGALTPGFCVAPVRAQTAASALPPVPSDAPHASEINAFAQADKQKMPPTGAVLFTGSSSIRLWETLTQDFSELPVINRGFGGSWVQDSHRYADRTIFPYKPKMIVFFGGTNDLASGKKTPQQVLQDYKNLVAKIHAVLPNTRIVYLAISPTTLRWKNEGNVMETNYLIQRFVFETATPAKKLNFINSHDELLNADGKPRPEWLREDGLHLNAEGYKAWTAMVKPRIMTLAAMDGVPRLDAGAVTPALKK